MNKSTVTSIVATVAAKLTLSDTGEPLTYNGARVVSKETEAEIVACFHKLYGLVGAGGELKWDECGNDAGRAAIAKGALDALTTRRRALREKAYSEVRIKCAAIFATYIGAFDADAAAFATLSPTLKARMGAFPTECAVPVAALVAAFPTGTPIETVQKGLSDMGYKLSDGRSKAPLSVVLDTTACVRYRKAPTSTRNVAEAAE